MHGSLAYLPGPAALSDGGELVLLDRKGSVEALKFPAQRFRAPRFSPTNGQQLAVTIDDGSTSNVWDP